MAKRVHLHSELLISTLDIGFLDSIVHISEEARGANAAIPYGISFAVLSSVVPGWGTSHPIWPCAVDGIYITSC